MKRVFLIVLLLFAASCYRPASNRSPQESADNSSARENASPVPPLKPARSRKDAFHRSITGSKGVVVLSEEYGKDDYVRIYNRDRTLWYQFSYYDEDAFDGLEGINTDFRPFAFHPDYFLLVMRIVGEDEKRYKVVVNEESGLTRFVYKNDKVLEVESWDKHVLETFAVDFDEKANPVLSAPDGDPVAPDFAKIELFSAEKTKGDWLLVSWKPLAAETGNKSESGSGWIRWRDGDFLLVELYYIS